MLQIPEPIDPEIVGNYRFTNRDWVLIPIDQFSLGTILMVSGDSARNIQQKIQMKRPDHILTMEATNEQTMDTVQQ